MYFPETVVLRREMGLMPSSSAAVAAASSGQWYGTQNVSSWFPRPQIEEDFSVDDLLDLGDNKEQSSDIEAFLELDMEEEEDERKESPAAMDASSVLSFQALPPSDPIVPAGDVADLEWVSQFVDDSYSEFPAAVAPFSGQHAAAAAPPLAVSKMAPPPPLLAGSSIPPKKTRSKRSRSGGRIWSLSGPLLFSESSSTSSSSSGSSSSSCSASSTISSCLLHESPPFPEAISVPFPAKKKGRKPKAPATGGPADQTRRRCTHCGVDKTPQWRAGPMGSKTLCNACGVRFKSGRLLPEYRPAGSPTFISHVHSNSHRKVLELRRKKEVIPPAACAALPAILAAPPQPYGVV